MMGKHGHVTPRADGMVARCGGPAICKDCAFEKGQLVTSRPHIGCNVTTCPNGKCRATGQCVDLPTVESPPLAPETVVNMICKWPAVSSRENSCAFPTCRCGSTSDVRTYPHDDGPRTIIAFTGLAGSGKSTAAHHLVNRRGFQRVRFAGPLKAMMASLGLTHEQIEGSEKEIPCALLGGKTPRYAMQTIGTEWGRDIIDSDLWIRAWRHALANVPPSVPVVVDDCRFPNEAAAVVAADGVLVRIERPSAGTASVHSSEAHALPAARTLHNTRDERNLREQVDVLVRDLSWADTAP